MSGTTNAYPSCALALMLLVVWAAGARAQSKPEPQHEYASRRAAERAAAEAAIKRLTGADEASLTVDDWIRLARAYNETSEHRLALEAICRVPDDELAKTDALELKAICFHNVNAGDDKSARVRELAFIDRCLEEGCPNHGVWLWRKAKLVCQASISPEVPTIGDVIGSPARIIDRPQYEYAFALLKRAFAVEPKLHSLAGVGHTFMWEQDFPLLSRETRFVELMQKHAPKSTAPGDASQP